MAVVEREAGPHVELEAQALEIIARALDMSLVELVAGTDVEERVAPEHQVVSREQHEQVLVKLSEAQAMLVEADALVKAKELRIGGLNAENEALRGAQLKLREAEAVASKLASERASAIDHLAGQLRESREHVFQLEQTVQAQAARIEGLELAAKFRTATLIHTQSQYTTLRASYDALWNMYSTLWKQHNALPPASTDPGPVIAAGLFGLGIGLLGGAAASGK